MRKDKNGMTDFIGILIGVVLIAGLIFAMGKMSEMGVDANHNFCDGDCKSCKSELEEELCKRRDEEQRRKDEEKFLESMGRK